jgi:hypothetical protein
MKNVLLQEKAVEATKQKEEKTKKPTVTYHRLLILHRLSSFRTGYYMDYKENRMSTDRENGRETKRARDIRKNLQEKAVEATKQKEEKRKKT